MQYRQPNHNVFAYWDRQGYVVSLETTNTNTETDIA